MERENACRLYFALLNTSPRDITKLTRSNAVTLSSGLESTPIISAVLPGAMVPASLEISSNFAALIAAA